LFLANSGPATVVDIRLEFQNPRLSFDYVKRCRQPMSEFSTTTIVGDQSIRASAGDVWLVTVEWKSKQWC
jgi:hypothetical protein